MIYLEGESIVWLLLILFLYFSLINALLRENDLVLNELFMEDILMEEYE